MGLVLGLLLISFTYYSNPTAQLISSSCFFSIHFTLTLENGNHPRKWRWYKEMEKWLLDGPWGLLWVLACQERMGHGSEGEWGRTTSTSANCCGWWEGGIGVINATSAKYSMWIYWINITHGSAWCAMCNFFYAGGEYPLPTTCILSLQIK